MAQLISKPEKIAVIMVKFEQCFFIIQSQTERQTVQTKTELLPGAVWSGSTLLALTCLFEHLGSLRYPSKIYNRTQYCKTPKILDTRKFAVITLKVEQDGFSLELCIQMMQPELQTV